MHALRATPRGVWGMALAHLGLGVFVAGVTVVSTLDLERDLRLSPGETARAAGLAWRLESIVPVEGPNYSAERGTVTVWQDGQLITTLHPEKRTYLVQRSPMTEAGIDAGVFRDLYIALGERFADGSWSVRVQHKPLVRWIWLGTLLMALGGTVSATDPRYRRLSRRESRSVSAQVST